MLHGLGVPRSALDRVHLTRDRQGGGQRRAWPQVHGHPLPDAHLAEVDGLAVTTVPRTVVDLACSLPLPDAVAVGDGALPLGATPADLASVLADVGPRRGVATARRALELLDGRSESYGESVSRVLMLERGFTDLVPKLLVRDERGVVVARVDFAWPALGVIGELDGRVKHGRTLAPGQDPTKALWDEKVREDLLLTSAGRSCVGSGPTSTTRRRGSPASNGPSPAAIRCRSDRRPYVCMPSVRLRVVEHAQTPQDRAGSAEPAEARGTRAQRLTGTRRSHAACTPPRGG